MSRNGSGTYTLPAGNPVVTGTTIESNWANTTLSDIATTLTDSLSRSGQGGMTAALRIADGTQGAPGLGFANETGSGFYRAGTGEVWATVQGAQTLNLDATGVTVPADKATSIEGTFVFNETGADKDARFEGDTDANLLFTDASTDRVGIGTNTPAAKLDVVGDVTVSGAVNAATVNATTLDLTNIEVTNIKAKDGTASMTLADATGVASFSANPVLSGGTANGVLYLNGSKVATSGSALTFSGTSLSVTGNFFSSNAGSENYYLSDGTTRTSLQQNGNALYYNVNDNSATNGQFIWRSTNALSELMRLTSTGLGIGTSSPGAKLHVSNGSNSDSGDFTAFVFGGTDATNSRTASFIKGTSTPYNTIFRYQNNTGTTTGSLIFQNGSTEQMRLDASGNLGLGVTPSGSYKLEVLGGGLLTGLNVSSGGAFNTANTATFDTNGAGVARFYSRGANAATVGSFQWRLQSSNGTIDTQAMTLDADGRLALGATGINGTSNRASFVNNVTAKGVLALQSTSTSGYSAIELYDSGGTQQGAMGWGNASVAVTGAASATYLYSTGAITFLSGGTTERARITSGGKLLVGTTTAGYGLFTEQRVTINPTNDGMVIAPLAENLSAYTVQANNNTGTRYAMYIANGSSAAVGTISFTSVATAYNTTSDYRLKDNPQPLTDSGAFIDALQPKTWEWKADGSRGVGFIAHEAQAVSPSSVVGEKDAVDDEGNPVMQAMEYGSAEFIANIIAELQSLRARVAALEAV